MKTFLAILGVVAILAVIVIGVGGYVAYKKTGSIVVTEGQKEVETFISTKHPSERVVTALRRMMSSAKLQKSSFNTMVLAGAAASTTRDGIVTEDELKMLDDAAQLAEQGQIPKRKVMEFMRKHENLPVPPGDHP